MVRCGCLPDNGVCVASERITAHALHPRAQRHPSDLTEHAFSDVDSMVRMWSRIQRVILSGGGNHEHHGHLGA